MSVLYKVDSRKRTYAEHWRIQWPNLDGFLIAAICKLLGIRQRHSFGIRRPETLNLHEPYAVPRLVRERLASTILACEELDLAFQFYASVDALVGSRVIAYSAALLNADGLIWVTIITTLGWARGTQRVGRVLLNCFSRLPDGRYVVTSDHAWKLTPHPGDLVELLVGAPPTNILARHFWRMEELEVEPVAVRQNELAQVILAREQRHVDYQIESGVYVPMTPEEVERITGRW